MRRRLIRVWLAVVATVLVPTGAAAQDTLSRWPGLDVTRLSTVYVVDDAGVETTWSCCASIRTRSCSSSTAPSAVSKPPM